MTKKNTFQLSEVRLEKALVPFVSAGIATQGSEHIKPVHWYLAVRLVLEGGFAPEDITPTPPLVVRGSGRQKKLTYSAPARKDAELAVIGGLKSKKIDVVVTKPGVGPVLAISVKGTKKAFRNLTNRMEEAIGDSTNLHIMYPGLVYGFFHVLQANQAGTPRLMKSDTSVDLQGNVVKAVRRYHDVLANLAGRRLVRDDYTRYEAVGFALVQKTAEGSSILSGFPEPGSPLAPEKFFQTLYQIYDLRYPYMSNRQGLARHAWSSDSPVFAGLPDEEARFSRFGYSPRIGVSDEVEDESED
ncbi:MAG: hypothetical protein FJ399_21090 [Verrucomicrobia bacterium]|nr:hypothetical protein [Verrucomicrobiota bacterium]